MMPANVAFDGYVAENDVPGAASGPWFVTV